MKKIIVKLIYKVKHQDVAVGAYFEKHLEIKNNNLIYTGSNNELKKILRRIVVE
jgi:hypothetical protein